MTALQVAKVLRSVGLPDKAGPHGFLLGQIREFYGLRFFRLERGGGIAGRLGTWKIVEVRSGEAGPAYKTEAQLRKALREWLAGPKPNCPAKWYVRLHKQTWGESYVWIKRIH